MEEIAPVSQGLVVAILPFINDNKYRVNCVVENMFKWKPEDTTWTLHVRNVIYEKGLFKHQDDMVKQNDNKMTMSTFFQIESNTPKFDYYAAFEEENKEQEKFILLADGSLVRSSTSLNVHDLIPVEIFYHIFKDLLTTHQYKLALYRLLDPETKEDRFEAIVNFLFELEKKTYPKADNHERIFCSRAASCYNLILCLGEVEQTINTNAMLQNSIEMIIKCARCIANTQKRPAIPQPSV